MSLKKALVLGMVLVVMIAISAAAALTLYALDCPAFGGWGIWEYSRLNEDWPWAVLRLEWKTFGLMAIVLTPAAVFLSWFVRWSKICEMD